MHVHKDIQIDIDI